MRFVNETDFVTQIPALIHHGERLPHACFDVDLLHVRGEAGAEASAKDDDFVRFRAKACTVGQRQLKFDFKKEPVAVLDAVPLNGIQSILPIVASKGVNKAIIDNCSGKCTLADIH